MYFLERKESYNMPNILGNCSQPVPTYRWKAIAMCEDDTLFKDELEKMDKKTHRITSNIVN